MDVIYQETHRAWLKSQTVEEIAKIHPGVKTLLQAFQERYRASSPQPPHQSAAHACPSRLGQAPVHEWAADLTPAEVADFLNMVSALRRYQKGLKLSDLHFTRKIPLLGSFKTWGYRMAVGDFRELNLRRWYPRIKAAIAELDKSEPDWRSLAVAESEFDGVSGMVDKIKAWQQDLDLTDSELSRRVTFSRQSWMRLKQKDWVLVPIRIWHRKLSAAIEKLGI